MSVFDNTLSPGSSVVFSRDYHNDLVGKLRGLTRPGRLHIQTSAHEVQVHPGHSDDGVPENDYPLVPRHVVLSDATNWGDIPDTDVVLRWTLTDGPGHFTESGGTEVETGISGSVTWTWSRSDRPARAWDARVDGKKLPCAVEVEVEAKQASFPHSIEGRVETVGDIPSGANNGTYWLVVNVGEVYEISGTSAINPQPVNFVPLYTQPISFVVSPARNPNAPTNIVPKIEPQEDIVYLDADGLTEIVFDDYTDPGAATYLTREVTVTMQDGSPPVNVQSLSSRPNANNYYLEGGGNIVSPTTTSDYTAHVTTDQHGDLEANEEWYNEGYPNIEGVDVSAHPDGDKGYVLYTGTDTGGEGHTRGLYEVSATYLAQNPYLRKNAVGWDVHLTTASSSASQPSLASSAGSTRGSQHIEIDITGDSYSSGTAKIRRNAHGDGRGYDVKAGQTIIGRINHTVNVTNKSDSAKFDAYLEVATALDGAGDPDWSSSGAVERFPANTTRAPLRENSTILEYSPSSDIAVYGAQLIYRFKAGGNIHSGDSITVSKISLRAEDGEHHYISRYSGPKQTIEDLTVSGSTNKIIKVEQSTGTGRAGQYVYAEPYDEFIPYTDPEAQANRAFQVDVDTPGRVTVEALYEDPDTGKTATATKVVRIRPSLDTTLAATAEPALPPTQLLPGDGRFRINMRKDFTLLAGPADKGPALDASAAGSWTDSRALQLARRLGVEDMDAENAPLQMLYEAGSLLVSALHRPTDNGLRRYEMTIPNGMVQEGQIVMLSTGAIRLTNLVSAPGDGEIWEGVGFLDGTPESDVYSTGNGAIFDVDVEASYGQTAGSGETLRFMLQGRPKRAEVEMLLPSKAPQAPGDRWHVRHRVTARWENGKQTTGTWSGWEHAETLPSDTATARYTNGAIHIDAKNPYGRAQWALERPADPMPYVAQPIPTHLETRPPTSLWDSPSNPPDFLVDLIQTAEGGSARPTLEQLTVPYDDDLLPVVSLPSGQPIASLEVVTGLIVRSDAGAWIGLGDQYVPFGGSVGSVIMGVTINDGSTDLTPGAGPGLGRFNIDAGAVSTITVKIEPTAAVQSINYVSGDAGALYVPSSGGPVESSGVYEHQLTARSSGIGVHRQTFVYEALTADSYETFRFEVENSAVDTSDTVVITSVSSSGISDEVNVTSDLTTTPPTYTLEATSTGVWTQDSARVLINGRGIQNFEVEGNSDATATVEITGTDENQTVTFKPTAGENVYRCYINKEQASEYALDVVTDHNTSS